jgi:hypothetical protein
LSFYNGFARYSRERSKERVEGKSLKENWQDISENWKIGLNVPQPEEENFYFFLLQQKPIGLYCSIEHTNKLNFIKFSWGFVKLKFILLLRRFLLKLFPLDI